MQTFFRQDPDYRDYLRRNPECFVINSYEHPTSEYIPIHTASCRQINGERRNAGTLTSYRKTCGTADELEAWALERTGAHPTTNCTCRPAGYKGL